jgi:RNA polymerase sigma-70 factor (ECF subfamily)
MVVAAQGESPEADKALGKLCRTYWWPIYSFIRRQGARPEEAEDLTQSFFALLFERRDLEGVRREKGRLRSFFFASLKNFLAKERRYAAAAKRGEGRALIPLDELLAHKCADLEPAPTEFSSVAGHWQFWSKYSRDWRRSIVRLATLACLNS